MADTDVAPNLEGVAAVASVLRWLGTPVGPPKTERSYEYFGPRERPAHSAVLREWPNGVVQIITGNAGSQRYRTFASYEDAATMLLDDVAKGVTEWPRDERTVTLDDLTGAISRLAEVRSWRDTDSLADDDDYHMTAILALRELVALRAEKATTAEAL